MPNCDKESAAVHELQEAAPPLDYPSLLVTRYLSQQRPAPEPIQQSKTFQNLYTPSPVAIQSAKSYSGHLNSSSQIPSLSLCPPSLCLDLPSWSCRLVDLCLDYHRFPINFYADIRISQEETDEGVAGSKRPCLSYFDFQPAHKPDNTHVLQRIRKFNHISLNSIDSSDS